MLTIFECAVDYIPGYVDADALQNGYTRNAILTSSALVSKAWALPAQKVLFRDISLGVRGSNIAYEIYQSGSDDDGEEFDGERYRPGRTGPALRSLITALEAFRDAGSAIPRHVRALHLCIGHTSAEGFNPKLSADHIIHGSPADVLRAVSLCPGLIHFSLVVGVYHPDDNDFAVFPPDGLAMLGKANLRNLRHLSVQTEADEEFFIQRYRYNWPLSKAAYQIIAALAPHITLLDTHLEFGDGEDIIDAPLPVFPKLHTLYSTCWTTHLQEAIRSRAPSLHRASLPWVGSGGLRELVPHIIRELCIMDSFGIGADISRFEELEALEIQSGMMGTILKMPQSLPRSLRRLRIRLPATAFDFGSLALEVAKAASLLPHLDFITFVRTSVNRSYSTPSTYTLFTVQVNMEAVSCLLGCPFVRLTDCPPDARSVVCVCRLTKRMLSSADVWPGSIALSPPLICGRARAVVQLAMRHMAYNRRAFRRYCDPFCLEKST